MNAMLIEILFKAVQSTIFTAMADYIPININYNDVVKCRQLITTTHHFTSSRKLPALTQGTGHHVTLPESRDLHVTKQTLPKLSMCHREGITVSDAATRLKLRLKSFICSYMTYPDLMLILISIRLHT